MRSIVSLLAASLLVGCSSASGYTFPGCESADAGPNVAVDCGDSVTFSCAFDKLQAEHVSCTQDSDCTLILPIVGCLGACETPVRADSADVFRAQVTTEGDKFCAAATDAGQRFCAIPPASNPTCAGCVVPACVNGTCSSKPAPDGGCPNFP
ncbi:MAG: hypothetical protein JST54_32030 [Deltaproteobacteria bacterium]|nr:hypothetical protein [Deltaproteobacteria bacterium]